MSSILPADAPETLPRAVEALQRGALVVLPTDTVYGLAALPWDAAAVQRLYAAKGRAAEKAIPVLVGAVEHLRQITANLPPCAERLARRFWPGALTLIVPKHPNLPAALSPYPTVGVRMPAHPFALRVLRVVGPLAVTSANRSGAPPARTAAEAKAALGEAVALIVDAGTSPLALPSTVVDCTTTPRVLRRGALAPEEIFRALEG